MFVMKKVKGPAQAERGVGSSRGGRSLNPLFLFAPLLLSVQFTFYFGVWDIQYPSDEAGKIIKLRRVLGC